MKTFLRSSGKKILFAFLFIVCVFGVQARAQVVNEILNRIEAHRKALTTLRSDVTMGKFDPSLNEWNYSKGKVILIAKTNNIKEGLFRVDWSEPRQEILAVVKGKYYAYTPSLKQVYTGEASGKKAEEKGGNVFSFLSMSKAELQASYKASLVGSETLSGGVVTAHVQFVPIKASKYKSADIWVDKDGMIHQVKTIPNSGDESYVRLTNIEQNISLNTSQFVLNLPKDVKIINS